MPYRPAESFYKEALEFFGFSSWRNFDETSTTKKWSQKVYLRKQHQINTLKNLLHSMYINGVSDCVTEKEQ